MRLYSILALIVSVFVGCSTNPKSDANGNILAQVDELHQRVLSQIPKGQFVLSVDHHRLAAEEGVYTPPAILTVFSDPQVNTPLIQINPRVGLDLPFKILTYTEPDTSHVALAFTSSAFIAKRHGLTIIQLGAYFQSMRKITGQYNDTLIAPEDLSQVLPGFGIKTIRSEFDFQTTEDKIKAVVMAQSDTKWFGEVDYTADAKKLSVDILPAKLLLFGGPAPGAQAMKTSPKIGLDAFCQKLLVFENSSGDVFIAFNDIADFAQLYYGFSTKPQEMINQRLLETFVTAVTEK